MSSELSKQAISDIKTAVREEMEAQRLKFWIEPEEHYRQHVALEGLLAAYKSAGSFFTRTFIGIAVVGVLAAALLAIKFGRG